VRYLSEVRRATEEKGIGRIATVVGRYYAMDRDRRWDRTRVAWEALVEGRACVTTDDPEDALGDSYAREVTDEFVKPIVVGGTPRIGDGDAVIFFNFRADRARQLTRTFTDPRFDGFDRELPTELRYATMTQYDRTFDLPFAFSPRVLTEVAGEVWERAACSSLRIAETEKYAHVTYFFNGGREEPYDREERILVPSPKVATYDLQPEMSAPEVTDRLVEAIRSGRFDSFVLNYANPDMVGHTGVLRRPSGRSRRSTRVWGRSWRRFERQSRTARSSSSPTTGTPRRWSRRTVRLIPPTRPTPSRAFSFPARSGPFVREPPCATRSRPCWRCRGSTGRWS
jgi:2,3-bisphosphoglycerate-independent phosphoglycerate mutase